MYVTRINPQEKNIESWMRDHTGEVWVGTRV